MENSIEPVLYIGISQSFFAGIVVSSIRPSNIANKLMAAWMFMICIELLFALLNSTVIEMYSFPFITFTYGPLLYLYVIFLTDLDRRFNWLSLLHFIPFVIFFTLSVIFRSEPLVKDLRGFFRSDGLVSLRIIYSASFFLSITSYSMLSFKEIRRHQHNLKNYVSFTSRKITLNWLKVLSISFYLAFLLLFIMGGLDIIGDFIPFDPYFVVFGFIALFSFVFSLYGIRQPAIFGELVSTGRQAQKIDTERYSRSGLKRAQADRYLKKLIDCMETKKPYLNGDLTIHDLSTLTGISRHYITQVLNEEYKRNFFTFINEYRVREVIKRFNEPQYNNYTILAIAFDSGFNSKTTFNSFFKVQTGFTPSEYRLNISEVKS